MYDTAKVLEPHWNIDTFQDRGPYTPMVCCNLPCWPRPPEFSLHRNLLWHMNLRTCLGVFSGLMFLKQNCTNDSDVEGKNRSCKWEYPKLRCGDESIFIGRVCTVYDSINCNKLELKTVYWPYDELQFLVEVYGMDDRDEASRKAEHCYKGENLGESRVLSSWCTQSQQCCILFFRRSCNICQDTQ